jgi:CRP/FNR family transcriptional regulator, dissimilatory nitrate respiration regulator
MERIRKPTHAPLGGLDPDLPNIPAKLAALAARRVLCAGERLFRSGGRVTHVFLVVSGEIRLVRRNRNGIETILQRATSGFVAEASLASTAYHCDAIAARNSAVWRFPAKALRAALDDDVNFRNAWMSRLAAEVRKSRAQCERLILHRAADRVFHYLEAEGTDGVVTLRQTRKSWAAELGMTHEGLYRTLHKLAADGMIEVDGARIAIVRIKSRRRALAAS